MRYFLLLCLACVLALPAVGQKKKGKDKPPPPPKVDKKKEKEIAKEKKGDFNAFWLNFQAQVKAQDKKKLADLCEFELYYIIRSTTVTVPDEKIEVSRGNFMKEQFELLFNANTRREIANIKSVNIGADMQDAKKRVAVVTGTNKAGKPARRRFFFELEKDKYQLVMVDEEQL